MRIWTPVPLLLSLLSCGAPSPQASCNYPYYSVPDGCSGGSPWAREIFHEACVQHDVCYMVGKSRESCDIRFSAELLSGCGLLCEEASLMALAVKNNPRGQVVFNNRHRNQQKFESSCAIP